MEQITSVDEVLMPRRLTPDNGDKPLLSGEFFETIEIDNPNCCVDDASDQNEPQFLRDLIWCLK